ncbi:unnamed protein product [Neospora caninum Liverpool]|nr:uncharacterized protein NCLIV_021360 [Neospora caninum Liverpool]CBZ52348.1 unnamed protein product [Neospora caninum Liverpool]|eukprot:XP_003882380.1 uncharacterized protein NCLIV_021360 [Neospora caninum Liverpool]
MNDGGREVFFGNGASWDSSPRPPPHPSDPGAPFSSVSGAQCTQPVSCSTPSPSSCTELTAASSPFSAPCSSSLPSCSPSASLSSSPVALCSPPPRSLSAVTPCQASPASSVGAQDTHTSASVSEPQGTVLSSSLLASPDSADSVLARDAGCERVLSPNSSPFLTCAPCSPRQRDGIETRPGPSPVSGGCQETGCLQDGTGGESPSSPQSMSLPPSSCAIPQASAGSNTEESARHCADQVCASLQVSPASSSSPCQAVAIACSSASQPFTCVSKSSPGRQWACEPGVSLPFKPPPGGEPSGAMLPVALDALTVHGQPSTHDNGAVPRHDVARNGRDGDRPAEPSGEAPYTGVSVPLGRNFSSVASDLRSPPRTQKALGRPSDAANSVSSSPFSPVSRASRIGPSESSAPASLADAQHTGEVSAAADAVCGGGAGGAEQAKSRLRFNSSATEDASVFPCPLGSAFSQRVRGGEGEARLNDLTSAFEFFRPRASPFPCTVTQQAEMYIQLLTGLVKLRASFWRSPRRSHAFSFHIFQIQNAKSDSDLVPYRQIFEPLFSRLGLPLAHTPAVPHLAEWVLLKNLSSAREAEEEQRENEGPVDTERGQHGEAAAGRQSNGGSKRHAGESASASGRRHARSDRSPPPSPSDDDVVGLSPFSGEGVEGQRCSAFSPLQSDREREGSPITELVKQNGPPCLGRALEDVYQALDSLFMSSKQAHDLCMTPALPEGLFESPQDASSVDKVRGVQPTRGLSLSAFAAERLGPPLSRLRSGSLGETERRCVAPVAGRGSGAVTASLSSRLSGFFPQPHGKQSFSRSGASALSHPDHGLRFFLCPGGLTGKRDWRGEELPGGQPLCLQHDVQISFGEVPASPASAVSVSLLVSPVGQTLQSSSGVSSPPQMHRSPSSNPRQDGTGALGASEVGNAAAPSQGTSELPSAHRPVVGLSVVVPAGAPPRSGKMTTRGAAPATQAGVDPGATSAEMHPSGEVAHEGRTIPPSLQASATDAASSFPPVCGATDAAATPSSGQMADKTRVSEGMFLPGGEGKQCIGGPMEASVSSSRPSSLTSCGQGEGSSGSANASVCRMFQDQQPYLSQAIGLLTLNVVSPGGGPGTIASACVSSPSPTCLRANGAPYAVSGAEQPQAMRRRGSSQPRSHASLHPSSLAGSATCPSSGVHAPFSPTEATGQGTVFPVSLEATSVPPMHAKRGSGRVSASASAAAPAAQSGSAVASQETRAPPAGDGVQSSVGQGGNEKDHRPSGSAGAVSGTPGEGTGNKQGVPLFSSSCGVLPSCPSSLPVAISLTPLQLSQLQIHPSNLALFTNLSLPSSSALLSHATGGVPSPLLVTGGGNVSLSQLACSGNGQAPANASAAFPLPSSAGDPTSSVFGSAQSQGATGFGVLPAPGFLLQNLSGASGGANASSPLRTQVTPSGQLFLSYSLPSGTTPGAGASVSSTAVGRTPFGGLKCGPLNVPFLRFPAPATAAGAPGAVGAGREPSEAAQSTGSDSRASLSGGQGTAPVGRAISAVAGAPAASAGPGVLSAARSVAFCERRSQAGSERQGELAVPGAPSTSTVGSEGDALCRPPGSTTQKVDACGADEERGTKDAGAGSTSDATSRSPFPLFQLFRNGWWATPIPPEDPPLDRDATEALLSFLPSFPAVVYDKEEHCFFSLWRMKDGLVQRRRCECALLGVREAHRQAVQTVCRLTRRPPGVVYDCKSGKWSVCVTRHNGRHRASFSVKKFGFEGAHEKAMDWYEAKRVQLGLHDNPTCAEIVDFDAGVKANPSALLDIVRKAVDAAPPAQPVRTSSPRQKAENACEADEGREGNDKDKKADSAKGGEGDICSRPLSAVSRAARCPGSGVEANGAEADSLPLAASSGSCSSSCSAAASSSAFAPSGVRQNGATAVVGDREENRTNTSVTNDQHTHVKDGAIAELEVKEKGQAEGSLPAPNNEASVSSVVIASVAGIQRRPELCDDGEKDGEVKMLEQTESSVAGPVLNSPREGTPGATSVCAAPRVFGGDSALDSSVLLRESASAVSGSLQPFSTDAQPTADSRLPVPLTASPVTACPTPCRSPPRASSSSSPASSLLVSPDATLATPILSRDATAGPGPANDDQKALCLTPPNESMAKVGEGVGMTPSRAQIDAAGLPNSSTVSEASGDAGRSVRPATGDGKQSSADDCSSKAENTTSGSQAGTEKLHSVSSCSASERDTVKECAASLVEGAAPGTSSLAVSSEAVWRPGGDLTGVRSPGVCARFDEKAVGQDAQTLPSAPPSHALPAVAGNSERPRTPDVPCGGNSHGESPRDLSSLSAFWGRAVDPKNRGHVAEASERTDKGDAEEEPGNALERNAEWAPRAAAKMGDSEVLRTGHGAGASAGRISQFPNGMHHGRQDTQGPKGSNFDSFPPEDREAASPVLSPRAERAGSGCADQLMVSVKTNTEGTKGDGPEARNLSLCESISREIKAGGEAVGADSGARKRACEGGPVEFKRRKHGTEGLSACLEMGTPTL